MIELSVATRIHGRCLSIPASTIGPVPLLVGFHGYAEDAETQIERLRSIPGNERWGIVSIQGLHRFYNRRTNQVVASWMTRQDRETAIADNLGYVEGCIKTLESERGAAAGIVFAGFSQGVAMAFRAAANLRTPVLGVIAVGGDVPPDISAGQLAKIPAVLIARGESDNLYPDEQFVRDSERLRESSVDVRAVRLSAGHEWPDDFAAGAGEFLKSLLRV